jgi:hypothetical protein
MAPQVCLLTMPSFIGWPALEALIQLLLYGAAADGGAGKNGAVLVPARWTDEDGFMLDDGRPSLHDAGGGEVECTSVMSLLLNTCMCETHHGLHVQVWWLQGAERDG